MPKLRLGEEPKDLPETSGKEEAKGLPRAGGDKLPQPAGTRDREIPENEGTEVKRPER